MGVFTASRVQSTRGGRLTPYFLFPQAKSKGKWMSARAALPRYWVVFKSPSQNSNEALRMLNRLRELTLPRLTAAPTVPSSTYI